jgi:hypothetical protein
MKKILISLVLFASIVLAQDGWETASLYNGRAWVGMETTVAKAIYLHGLYDGQFNAGILLGVCNVEKEMNNKPIGVSYKEMVAILDTFYSDQSNARVPIFYALVWAKKKTDGANVRELDDFAAKLRRTEADLAK